MEYNGVKVLVSEGAFKEYKNDELKDIIEYLEDPDMYIEDFGYCYKRLSLNDTNILLDYINNLEYKIHKALEYIKSNIVDFNICPDIQDYERIEVEVHYLKSLIEILKKETK